MQFVLRAAGLGDLQLIEWDFVGVVGGIEVGRIMQAVNDGLGFHNDLTEINSHCWWKIVTRAL